MKCSQHLGTDAVGMCIACGRGLCPECARLSPEDKIVCSDECERTTLRTAVLRHAEARRYATDAGWLRQSGIVWRLLGVACTIAGLFNLFLTFVAPRFGRISGAMKPVPSIGFGVLMLMLTAIFVTAARLCRSLSQRLEDIEREFENPRM